MPKLEQFNKVKRKFIIFRNDILNNTKWINKDGVEKESGTIAIATGTDGFLRTFQYSSKMMKLLKYNPNYKKGSKNYFSKIDENDTNYNFVELTFYLEEDQDLKLQYLDEEFKIENWKAKKLYEELDKKTNSVIEYVENKLNV